MGVATRLVQGGVDGEVTGRYPSLDEHPRRSEPPAEAQRNWRQSKVRCIVRVPCGVWISIHLRVHLVLRGMTAQSPSAMMHTYRRTVSLRS